MDKATKIPWYKFNYITYVYKAFGFAFRFRYSKIRNRYFVSLKKYDVA